MTLITGTVCKIYCTIGFVTANIVNILLVDRNNYELHVRICVKVKKLTKVKTSKYGYRIMWKTDWLPNKLAYIFQNEISQSSKLSEELKWHHKLLQE